MLLSAAIIVRDEADHSTCASRRSTGSSTRSWSSTPARPTRRSTWRAATAPVARATSRGRPTSPSPRNRSLELRVGRVDPLHRRRRAGPSRRPRRRARTHLAAATDHVSFRVRFVPRVHWTPYREFRLWRHRPDIRFPGAIHESMLPAIDRVRPPRRTADRRPRHGRPRRSRSSTSATRATSRTSTTATSRCCVAASRQTPIGRSSTTIWRASTRTSVTSSWPGPRGGRGSRWHASAQRIIPTTGSCGSTCSSTPSHVRTPTATSPRCSTRRGALPGQPRGGVRHRDPRARDRRPGGVARRLEQLIALDLDVIVDTGSAYDERIFGEWAWHGLGLCLFPLDDFAGAAESLPPSPRLPIPRMLRTRDRRRLAEARRLRVSAGAESGRA